MQLRRHNPNKIVELFFVKIVLVTDIGWLGRLVVIPIPARRASQGSPTTTEDNHLWYGA